MCKQGMFNLCNNLEAISWNYPGTFAEYVAIPEKALRFGNLLKAPKELKDEEVCLAEPLACVINGQDLLKIKAGETVLIIGAGPIGILHAELARIKGAKRIILAEKSAKRLEKAKEFGYTDYIDTDKYDLVDEIMKITKNRGVDVTIVTAPAKPVFEQSIKTAAVRGRISFFASLPVKNANLNIDSRAIHYKELTIVGASASSAYHMQRALDIISTGNIRTEKIITHQVKLDELVDGIKMCLAGESLKVYVKNPN